MFAIRLLIGIITIEDASFFFYGRWQGEKEQEGRRESESTELKERKRMKTRTVD